MTIQQSNSFGRQTPKTTVTVSKNKEKDIVFVSFYNPFTDIKTTRSLGKINSISEQEIENIKTRMIDILNNFDYFNNFDNFIKEINGDDEIEKALEFLFYGSDVWQKMMRYNSKNSDEEFISIIENNKFCYDDSIAFIGQKECGKTHILLQAINSFIESKNTVPIDNFYIKYNKKNLLRFSVLFNVGISSEEFNLIYLRTKKRCKILGVSMNCQCTTCGETVINDKLRKSNPCVIAIQIELKYANRPIDDKLRYELDGILYSFLYRKDCYISSLKLEGNFKSNITELQNILDKKEELLLIESKSIGVEMEYENTFIQNIIHSKKLVWVMDINVLSNICYSRLFDMLRDGNYLNKTKLVFSKCDLLLDNYKVKDLYVVGNSILHSIDYYWLTETFYLLGDMNRNIEGNSMSFKFRGKMIKDPLNDEYKKTLNVIFND